MAVQPPRGFHPWHDIPTGRRPPDELTAVIEIPTNERNKYELDKELGIYRLDRVLHSAVHYPGDYGFLPRTLGEDGDPLDVLVLMTIPVFTGCLVEARPIGLFHLVDRGIADEKVLAVPESAGRSGRERNCPEAAPAKKLVTDKTMKACASQRVPTFLM
jgi:inorganic pyrophosphatase